MSLSAATAASDDDGILFRVGQLLARHCSQATGERKGSLRAVCNHLNFIVPGARWCDHAEDAVPIKEGSDL